MAQPSFDWSRDVALPVSGRSPQAKHASATGAQIASRTRGAVTLAYLALLKACGPLSDHAAAKMLARPLSSMNSIRNGLGDLVRPSGHFEDSEYGTRRVKWVLSDQ